MGLFMVKQNHGGECETGLAQTGIKELIYKVVTSVVFLATYTDKRNTFKASYALWF